MAGSAVQLSTKLGSIFSGGLSDSQKGMLDALNTTARNIGVPKLDLSDPESLIKEAERLQRMGDQDGAIKLLNRARQLQQQKQAEQAQLQPINVKGTELRQGATEAASRGKLAGALRNAGLTLEADQVVAKTMSMEAGIAALRTTKRQGVTDQNTLDAERRRVDRALAKEGRVDSAALRAKKLADDEKVKQVQGSIAGIFKTMAVKQSDLAEELMKSYGPNGLKGKTLGELNAIEGQINRRWKEKVDKVPGDRDFWVGTTGDSDDAALEMEATTEDIIEDHDLHGDYALWPIASDVDEYSLVISESIATVAKYMDISVTDAKLQVMADFKAGAEAGTIKSSDDLSGVIQSNYKEKSDAAAIDGHVQVSDKVADRLLAYEKKVK